MKANDPMNAMPENEEAQEAKKRRHPTSCSHEDSSVNSGLTDMAALPSGGAAFSCRIDPLLLAVCAAELDTST